MSDLIDRQAALDCFHDWIDKRGDVHTADEMPEYSAIEELPSVQPDLQPTCNKLATDCIERQAAIDAVCEYCEYFYNENVIQSIKGIPSVQPEKMQLSTDKTQLSKEDATKDATFDCISRQAAKDALAKFVPYAICDESTESYTNGLTDAYNLICQLPSVQPEIIRCEECRWGREVCGNIECFVDSNLPPEYHGYEWFCPNGERRTDE